MKKSSKLLSLYIKNHVYQPKQSICAESKTLQIRKPKNQQVGG